MRGRYLLIIGLALIASILFGEFAVRYILGYPDYGIERFIYGISSSTPWQPQYRPYSRYLNNEVRGLNVFSRNNIGLPGNDTDTAKKAVFVLGSSFIEAAQIPPDKMASSVFQDLIGSRGEGYAVYNLGRKAHDLYDSWFRYNYYKRLIEPDTVILILDQRNSFDRHKLPLEFKLPDGFGREDNRLKTRMGNFLLSRSAFSALLYRGFRDGISNAADVQQLLQASQSKPIDEDRARAFTLSCIRECLDHFAADARDKLIVISMFDKPFMNQAIDSYCNSLGIRHASSDTIQRPEFQLKNMGHLNIEGNALLGEFAARTFLISKNK